MFRSDYFYDGLGRRTNTSKADGTYLSLYSRDGQLLFGSSPAYWTRYVYLGGKQIAESTSAGVTTYVHTDALGSPVAKTNAAGALISRTRYEPYGYAAAGTHPTGPGFTAHVNDTDTGLVYMQQRYYDPLAGRFLSTDPVATDGNVGSAFNRFNYGENNPYRFTDPDGRQSITLTAAFVTGAVVLTLEPGRAAFARAMTTGVQVFRTAGAAVQRGAAAIMAAVEGEDEANSEDAKPSESKPTSGATRPEGVPGNWVEVPSRDGKGTKWVDPSNRKGGDYVRERGDGTLTQVKNGRALDLNGNAASGLSSPEAHFPRDQWKFRP